MIAKRSEMKVIYVATRSVSEFRAILPPGWDVRSDATRAAVQAAHLAARVPGLRMECWRPEVELTDETSYVDEYGIRHRAFPSRRSKPGHDFSGAMLRALRQATRRGRVVVEVHAIYGSPLGYAVPLIMGCPTIGQSHGWSPASSADPKTLKGKLLTVRIARLWMLRGAAPSLTREWIERRVLHRYTHIFAANSNEEESLLKVHPSASVSLRPWPIDFDFFRPTDRAEARRKLGLLPRDNVILSVGRLEEPKGVRYLVDAFPLIAQAHPSCRLVIVGDGSSASGLHREVERLGCAGRVSFLGRQERDELLTLYAAADVLVQPSLKEGCSEVTREAMACGTPVVATDVGGSKDITRHFECGIVVPVRDSKAIADAVDVILRKPEEFRPNIERGRAAFGWEAFAEERLRMYERVLSKSHPGAEGEDRIGAVRESRE